MEGELQRQGGRRHWWPIVGLLVIWGIAGLSAYTAYRVMTFSNAVFGDSVPPAPAATSQPAPTVPAPAPTPGPPGRAVVPAAPAGGRPGATATPSGPVRPVATPASTSSSGLAARLRAQQRLSFLLIGHGGGAHEGPYLTDALVIGTFDPRTATLALVNVPRDLWVLAPPGLARVNGYRKINEVFGLSLGAEIVAGKSPSPADLDRAAWQTARLVEQVVGLPIDGWIVGDFAAVRKVIDSLGGVSVTVERAFDDYQYPRHDDPGVDSGVMHIHFDAGPQRLSGERALQYVRSRNAAADGGDFGRSRRQQRLLVALKDTLLSPAVVPRVFGLMDAVQGHLRTSLGLTEARDLLLYGSQQNSQIRSVPIIIDSENLLAFATSENGASILVPRAGMGNFSGIHRHIQATLTRCQSAAAGNCGQTLAEAR